MAFDDSLLLDRLVVDDDDVIINPRCHPTTTKARRPTSIMTSSMTSHVSGVTSLNGRYHGNEETGADADGDVCDKESSGSDGSSLGSTLTATTVKTAINKSRLLQVCVSSATCLLHVFHSAVHMN